MLNKEQTLLNWFNFNKKIVSEKEKQHKTLPIVCIHGANQTSLSFSYLKTQLTEFDFIDVNYSSTVNFYTNLEKIVLGLPKDSPLNVIGHSLGGIYAIHLTKYLNIKNGISLSTPFRGSSTADWAKFIVPGYQLFRDVGRKSKPITESMKIKLNIPWTQVVSTKGSVPYHNGPNDSVVTIASMMSRDDVDYVHVDHNHYEVMCSDTVVDIIKSKLLDDG
jgi:pimeloyl-ACP methyl ester carboxylesterase